MGPACPQPIAQQSKHFDPTNQTAEDCLTLNIYTPISGRPRTIRTSAKRGPVFSSRIRRKADEKLRSSVQSDSPEQSKKADLAERVQLEVVLKSMRLLDWTGQERQSGGWVID